MSAASLDIHLTDEDLTAALRTDVREGLAAEPKWLPPKWFYDARGSELFELITELPEYYPTRTERPCWSGWSGRSPSWRRPRCWWSSVRVRRPRPGCCSRRSAPGDR